MKKVFISIYYAFSTFFILSSNEYIYQKTNFDYDGEINSQITLKASPLPEKWYQKAVFYELFVREFLDTDGDGIGDFNGVTKKLDYLKELGIGAIWLMPVTESDDNDHCYSVIDYFDIEDDYGSTADFENLISEAHKRDIAIIMDLVINHCSSNHPFFASANESVDSRYRDWFIWSEKRFEWYSFEDPLAFPKKYYNWDEINDNNFNWHRGKNGDYYFGLFYSGMPDFNYRNEEVYQYFKEVMTFWINKGIDGFRIDAARHIVENGKNKLSDQPETYEVFKGFRKVLDKFDNRYIIGEADNIQYLGDGKDCLTSIFYFDFALKTSAAIYNEDSTELIETILKLQTRPEGSNISNVLSCHDSYLGARPATRLKTIDNAKIAASVLLLLPDSPYVYYGDEIGMKNSGRYDGDWALRSPMQWDGSKNAGFTSARKPYGRKVNRGYKNINVEKSIKDDDSIYNHYKNVISVRNSYTSLQNGKINFQEFDKRVLSFVRFNDKERIYVYINLSSKDIKLDFSSSDKQIIFGGKDFYVQNEKIVIKGKKTLIFKERHE